MDLSELSVPETSTIHLEFPGRGPLFADDAETQPITISVYGPASAQAQAWQKKVRREARDLVAKRGSKGLWKQSDEELERQELDRLCALTAEVRNLVYHGEEIGADRIRLVYRDPKMGWLTDQVKERLAGWADFLLAP